MPRRTEDHRLTLGAERAVAEQAGRADGPGHWHQHRARPRRQHRLPPQVQIRTAGRYGERGQPGAGGVQVFQVEPAHHTRDRGTGWVQASSPAGWERRASSISPTRSNYSSSVRPISPTPAKSTRPMRTHWLPSRSATSFRALGRSADWSSVHQNDGPSFALLARALAHIVDEPETFDPAFRLPGK